MIDIGFIGLGTMGRPMAGHLQAAGHRLFLHSGVHTPHLKLMPVPATMGQRRRIIPAPTPDKRGMLV